MMRVKLTSREREISENWLESHYLDTRDCKLYKRFRITFADITLLCERMLEVACVKFEKIVYAWI